MKCALIILFSIMFQCCYSQLSTCESIRKGKFTLVDENAGNTYIIRRKNSQIEHGSKSKIILKSKISWIDSCTYTLELIEILKNPNNFPVPERLRLTVEIIEVNNNYYKCIVRDVDTNRTLERKIYFGKI